MRIVLFFRSPLKVISEIDVNKVHRLTMDILTKKGIIFQFDDACEVLSAYGARKSGNIVYMDESIIEKALGTTPKHFFMQAREGNIFIPRGRAIPEAKHQIPITSLAWKTNIQI
ncbi:trimethylamine methyltransferase family protein [Desulfococcaceae bacterium HSG7]|nr:trimethylamine methyltransferase family protein [Desulfococcaceae bacterium HSG7]